MTQQEVIKAFMASLANHGYSSSSAGNMLDSAIRASSRYSSASNVIAAMKADQVNAEKQAVEEILGSSYAGKTISQVGSSITSAKAKNNSEVTELQNSTAILDSNTTVSEYILERKAEIFLETYCGIQLNDQFGFYTNGNERIIARFNKDTGTGNTDTGAITGSDAGGSPTSKTASSVVPETFANTYKATTSAAQTIVTNERNWVVQATSADDTITANGADSINAGDGADTITVNASGATVTSGDGNDVITVNQTVNDITLSDLNSDDALTISGEFEIGSAHIEDTLLVVTDKTGTRKIRLGDFDNAQNASVNVNGSTSTTIAQWLSKAGIVYSSLTTENYADKALSSNSAENTSGEGRIALDDYTPPTVEEPVVQQTNRDEPVGSFNASEGDGSITVNLANVDASKAGNVTVNGQVVGTLSSEFPNASTFTRNGLTIHLLGVSSSSSPDNITAKKFDELTDDQKTIVASLFKWWAGEALTLNEESYGIGFNSSTAMVKDIGLYFYNADSSTLAAVWNWQRKTSDGAAYKLMLNVNMKYYSGIKSDDMNGEAQNDQGYLDRTLAHEFTHAVMAANVNYFNSLPQFIKEGTAELTHGIDDERGSRIFEIAYDADRLATAVSLTDTGTGTADCYAGGFMFMRYLAKQAAAQTQNKPAFGEITATVNVSTDGIYYINGNSTNETAQVAASESAVPTGAIKLGELKNGVYTVNDTGVHQNISGVNKVAGLTVNDTFNGTDNADTITTAQGSNIITGGGDDSINLYGQYATINAGAGDDTVNVLDGSHHSIDAGDGDNLVVFEPSLNYNNTVTSGAGNDTVSILSGEENLFDLGAGDDSISFGNSNSTILAGDGNDKVSFRYTNQTGNFVDLGAGNDSVLVGGTGNTITGGEGDDTITQYSNNAGGNVFVFDTENFGNDDIWNFKATDKIILGAGFEYSTSVQSVNYTGGGTGTWHVVTVTKGNDTVGTITVKDPTSFDAATNIVTSHIEIDGLTYNKAGYYEIADAQDLVELATYVNAGKDCRDMTFKVTTDIDMSTAGNFTPIGKSDNLFAGTFDGGGKTISNLSINTNKRCVALFSYLDAGGTIKDVVLSNATVQGNYSGGGLIGSLVSGLVSSNYGTITNCKVDAQLDGILNSKCGALVCTNYGTVTGNTFHSNYGAVYYTDSDSGGTASDNTRVYAVNAPTGFEVSKATCTDESNVVTIGDKTFYKQGAQVTATVTATDNHLVIDGEPSFTATIGTADMTLDVQYHVQLAGGEDYMNEYSNVSVLGSAGNDTIINAGENVTIDGGEGNDEIYNGVNGVLIDVSEGDDSILSGLFVNEFDVRGFGVGDTIDLYGTVNGGLSVVDGKLIATAGYKPVTIGGISAFSTDGKAWALDGNVATYGDGKTAGAAVSDGKIIFTDATVTDAKVQLGGISNLDGLSVLESTDYNEVNIRASVVGDNGASVVSNEGNYAFYLHDDWDGKTFTGSDTVDNIILDGYATNVSVNAGDGNDTIENYGGSNNTIDGGAGDDYIRNYGNNNTIDGGAGNDEIVNRGSNVSIDGGADDDTIIFLAGTSNTVNTAQGNDTIKIDTGNDVNDFTVENFTAGDVIQFIGYVNNDNFYPNPERFDDPDNPQYIQVAVNIDSLKMVDGKLVATAGGKTVTINGLDLSQGEGWKLDGNTATYFTGISEGAFNDGDKISFRKADKRVEQVVLGGISKAPTVDGNKVKLTAYNFAGDTVSVKSNVGKYEFSLSGDLNGKTFTGSKGVDKISNEASNVAINGGAGNDDISNSGNDVIINAGKGNDSIENSSAKVTIDGGAGSNIITLKGNNGTSNVITDTFIKADKGANTIQVGADMKKFSVNGFGRDDVIELNQLLGVESFNVVEGNLVAGDVTVSGLGTFDQSGSFSAAEDGSIVYTVTGKESITVAKTTQSSDGSNVTSLVYRKDGSALATYSFTLGGLSYSVISTSGTASTTTSGDDLKVTYVAGGSSYVIQKGSDTTSYYSFATGSGGTSSLYLVKLVEGAGGSNYTLPAGYSDANTLALGMPTNLNYTDKSINVSLNHELLPSTHRTVHIAGTSNASNRGEVPNYYLDINTGGSSVLSSWNSVTWSESGNGFTGTATGLKAGWVDLSRSVSLTYQAAAEQNTLTVTITGGEGSFENGAYSSANGGSLSGVVFNGYNVIIGDALLGDNSTVPVTVNGSISWGSSTGTETAKLYLADDLLTSIEARVDAAWDSVTNGSVSYMSDYRSQLGYDLTKNDNVLADNVINISASTASKGLFTISGLSSSFVVPTEDTKGNGILDEGDVKDNGKVGFLPKVTETKSGDSVTGYTVALGASVLNGILTAANKNKDIASSVVRIANVSGANYGVGLSFASDVTQAMKKQATLTGQPEYYNATNGSYSSLGLSSYFALGEDSLSVTAYKKREQQKFTIKGLSAATDIDDIDFKIVDQADNVGKHYLFEFKASALSGQDVDIASASSTDKTAIWGVIDGNYEKGSVSIAQSATVTGTDNKTFTYTAAGWQAGYLLRHEIGDKDTAAGGYASELSGGHSSTAEILYVDQRHGEQFTITGLSAGTLNKINSNMSASGAKILAGASVGTITFADGVELTSATGGGWTLNLSASALAPDNIVFSNSNYNGPFEKSVKGGQSAAYNPFTITLGRDVTTLSMEGFSAPKKSADTKDYFKAFTDAWVAKAASGIAADSSGSLKSAAGLSAITKGGQSSLVKGVANYTYQSSYNKGFYTQALGYSATAMSSTELVNAKYMADAGQTVFKYTEAGEIFKNVQFTITGLEAGLQAAGGLSEIRFKDEKAGDGITVDYTGGYSVAGETGTFYKVYVGKDALPTVAKSGYSIALDMNGKTFDIDGDGQDDHFVLALKDDLADTLTVQNIAFSAAGGKTATENYTVTGSGSTAGWALNNNNTPDDLTDDYLQYYGQKGGQQVVVGGLSTGKTLTSDMFTFGVSSITFNPVNSVLSAFDNLKTGNKITLEYKGLVTTEHGYSAPTLGGEDRITLLAIDVSGLSVGTGSKNADWTAGATSGAFVYTTDFVQANWSVGSYSSKSHTIAAEFTAARGGESLIMLGGLSKDVTLEQVKQQSKIYAVDKDNNFLVSVSAGNAGGVSYYKVSDIENGSVKAGAQSVAFKGYVFNLESGIFTPEKMLLAGGTSITFQQGTINDNVSPYHQQTLGVAFDGVLAKETQSTVAATLTAVDGEAGVYKYVADHTPAYFKDTKVKGTGSLSAHNFNFVRAVNQYGFTIAGLSTDINPSETGFKIDNYFTTNFSNKSAQESGKFVVTLGASAIEHINRQANETGIIWFKHRDLDGDKDGNPDTVVGGQSVSIVFALPKNSDAFRTAPSVAAAATFDVESGTAKDAATAVYNYTSMKHHEYFSLAGGSLAVDFTAESGGEKLFAIGGLKYGGQSIALSTLDATGGVSIAGGITVIEGGKSIILYKTALAGENITLTPETGVTGYKLSLFDEAAYNAGLSKATAAGGGGSAAYKTMFGSLFAPTDTVHKAANFAQSAVAKGAQSSGVYFFTAGYTPEYYQVSSDTLIGYTAATGYKDTLQISGLSTAISFNSTITESTATVDGKVGGTVFTVTDKTDTSKKLFEVTYIGSSSSKDDPNTKTINESLDNYIFKAYDASIFDKTENYSLSVMGGADRTSNTVKDNSGFNAVFALDTVLNPESIAAAISVYDTTNHSYKVTMPGMSEGFGTISGGGLSYHKQIHGETFSFSGLTDGLGLAYAVVSMSAGNDSVVTDTVLAGLGLTSAAKGGVTDAKDILVRFANYDDYIYAINNPVTEGDNQTIKYYDKAAANANVLRISRAALDTSSTIGGASVIFTAFDVSTLDDSKDNTPVKYTFGGLTKDAWTATTGTTTADALFVTTAPTAALTFDETQQTVKTGGISLSNYHFESSHVPEYFLGGTSVISKDTVQTYTYHGSASYASFTLHNIAGGLSSADVKVGDDNVTNPKISISLPTNGEAGTVMFSAGALSGGEQSFRVSISGGQLFDGKTSSVTSADFNLVLDGEGDDSVNSSSLKVVDVATANFVKDTVSNIGGVSTLVYTSPKYDAYYTANNGASGHYIDYAPQYGQDTFSISGLKSGIASVAGVETLHGFIKDNVIGAIAVDDSLNGVTVTSNALPTVAQMSETGYVLRFTNGANKNDTYTFTLDGIATTPSTVASSVEQKMSDQSVDPNGTITYTASVAASQYLGKLTDTEKGYVEGSETYGFHSQVGGAQFQVSGLTTTSLEAATLEAGFVVAPDKKTITLNSNVLPTSLAVGQHISITGINDTTTGVDGTTLYSDYKFSLASDAATASITATDTYGTFSLQNGATNNYSFQASGTTEGFAVESLNGGSSSVIVYNKEKGRTTFDIEGLMTGLAYTRKNNDSVESYLAGKGITIGSASAVAGGNSSSVTVTLGRNAIYATSIGSVVKLTDTDSEDGIDYKLALDTAINTGLSMASVAGHFDTVTTAQNVTSATYKTYFADEFFALESGTESGVTQYNYNPSVGGATFQISGLKSGLTVASLTTGSFSTAIDVTEEAGGGSNVNIYVTINDTSVLGTIGSVKLGELSTIAGDTITYGNLVMEIGEEAQSGDNPVATVAPEQDGEWSVKSGTGKATWLDGGKKSYYSIAGSMSNATELKFVSETPNESKFELSGFKTGSDLVDSIKGGLSFADNTVTITAEESLVNHANNGLTIFSNNGGYSVFLGAAIKLNGTTGSDTIIVGAESAIADGGAGDDLFTIVEAGSVYGGAGADTINVEVEKGAWVDGGAGNDYIGLSSAVTGLTLNFSAGHDTITWAEGLKIANLTGYTYTFQNLGDSAVDTVTGGISAGAGDLVLSKGNASLTILNGAGQSVAFVDSKGDESSVEFKYALDKMLTFTKSNTVVSLHGSNVTDPKMPFYGTAVGPDQFAVANASSVVATIDASAYNTSENGLVITGNQKPNYIIGTDKDDTIDGAEGNDTFKGGGGSDVFIFNGGNLTITDFNTKGDADAIWLNTYTVPAATEKEETAGDGTSTEPETKLPTVTSALVSGNKNTDLVFTLDSNKTITLQNVFKTDSVTSVALFNEAGESISNNFYFKDGSIVNAAGSAVTLTSKYTVTSYLAGASVAFIDATDAAKALFINASLTADGVEILGSSKNGSTILGGSGADTFTGAGNKADLFIYDVDNGGGADIVTNFEQSKDKVSIKAAEGTLFDNIYSTSVDDEASVVTFTFNGDDETNTFALSGAVSTKEVTINGSKLFVGENMFLNDVAKKATAITLTAGANGAFDATATVKGTGENASTTSVYSAALKTIDASHVAEEGFTITGNAAANVISAGLSGNYIFAGLGNDTIYDGAGDDTINVGGGQDVVSLRAGGGSDIIIFDATKNTDKLTIYGYEKGDAISIASSESSVSIGEVKYDVDTKGNVIFTVYNSSDKSIGTVVVNTVGAAKDADNKLVGMNISVKAGTLTATNYNYSTAGIADGTSITLASGTRGTYAATATYTNVNAENAPNVTLITAYDETGGTLVGNAVNNSLIGGKGNDYLVGKAGKDSLIGKDGKDTLDGGDGDDYLFGGLSANLLIGGDGKDTFVFNGGSDTISDYKATDDKISVGSGWTFASYAIGGLSLTLNYTTGGGSKVTTASLFIAGGADQPIHFVSGKTTTTEYYSTLGTFNNAVPSVATALTLAAGVNTAFDATKYKSLITVDSSQVTTGISITGNDLANYITNAGNSAAVMTLIGGKQNDKLFAGTKGDWLIGGLGNDTFSLNSGADTVAVGDGGTDSIGGFDGSKDYLVLAGTSVVFDPTAAVLATVKSGNDTIHNLTLKFNDPSANNLASIVVLGGVSVGKTTGEATVTIGTDEYKFGIGTVTKGTEMTLTSGSAKDTYTLATDITKVDASANTTGVSITGGTNTTLIIGGKGVDTLTLTKAGTIQGGAGADVLTLNESGSIDGGEGNDKLHALKGGTLTGGNGEDIFYYEGGKVTITDYTAGKDQVSLKASVAPADGTSSQPGYYIADLKKITLTAATDSTALDTLQLDFESGTNELTFTLDDAAKKAIKFFDGTTDKNGKTYTFPQTGVMAIGTAASVITDSISFAVDGSPYTSAFGKADKVTLDGSSATAPLKLTLNGTEGSAVGGKGADVLTANNGGTLTGGDGKDTFVIGGGSVFIADYSVASASIDKISINSAYVYDTGEAKSDGNVVLTYKEKAPNASGKFDVTIKGGSDAKLNLVEGGKSTVRKFSTLGVFNSNETAITLASGVTGGFNVNDSNYKKINRIDAHNVSAAASIVANTTLNGGAYITNADNTVGGFTLVGGNYNDSLFAGKGSATAHDVLDGGKGADVLISATEYGAFLIGGAGNDTFVANDKDTVQVGVVGSKDIDYIQLAGGSAAVLTLAEGINIADAKIATGSNKLYKDGAVAKKATKQTNLTLTLEDATGKSAGSVVLQGISLNAAGSADVTIGGSTYTFTNDGIISVTSGQTKGVSLTSMFKGDTKDKKNNPVMTFKDEAGTYDTINASAVSKNITITSGKNSGTVTIVGSDHNDYINATTASALYGGKGNDTFNPATVGSTAEGGAGNDTFIYNGGTLQITDFSGKNDNKNSAKEKLGVDKISLRAASGSGADSVSAITMFDSLTAVSVERNTVESGTTGTAANVTLGGNITLAFGNDNTLTIGAVNIDNTFNIADDKTGKKGANFKFEDGIYAIGKSATVLSATETVDAVGLGYTSYTGKGANITLNGGTAAKNKKLTLTLVDDGAAIGGAGADNLVAAGGSSDSITLTGGKGNDIFKFDGGNLTIIDYSSSGTLGADKVSLGAGWSITAVSTVGSGDNAGIELGLTYASVDTAQGALDMTNSVSGSITLYNTVAGGIDGESKVSLITTPTTIKKTTNKKTKQTTFSATYKATKATNVYFTNGAIYNASMDFGAGESANVTTKATAVSLMSASADANFAGTYTKTTTTKKGKETTSTLASSGSVKTIVAEEAPTATLYGGSAANTITLKKGGTVAGGLGNDTFIVSSIESGSVYIEDFGIGATHHVTTESSENTSVKTTKLATKVSISGYDAEDPTTYAPGKDVLQIAGSITGVTLDNITTGIIGDNAPYKKDTKTTSTPTSFSVTLTVDADGKTETDDDSYTIVLEDIHRSIVTKKTGKLNVGDNSKTDYTELTSLNIKQNGGTGSNYTKFNWLKNGSLIHSNYIDSSGNALLDPVVDASGSARLDDIIDVPSAGATGSYGDNSDPLSTDPTQTYTGGNDTSSNKNKN